jgi:ceramide glucosyltransferase
MFVLARLAGVCVIISLLYYTAAIIAAMRFARRAVNPAPPLPKIAPRVAVLKPLHGLSNSLAENLISYLELGYPRLEFIFGVSSYDDPAAGIPVALKQRYQFAQITLVVGAEPNCVNLKVAKLIKMADRAAKDEIFVLSDADVAVDRGHLRLLVGELTASEKTGVVTCLYRARPIGTLASRLEALFVNTDFAPMVMLSSTIEPVRYALGATIAIKRQALEAIGGFRALKDLIADDYHLGQMAANHGYGVILSTSLVTIACEERRFADFWNHQLRWARTYRTARPASLATILLNGPFWALVLLFAAGLNSLVLGALAIVIIARIAMAALLMVKILRVPECARDLWIVPLKDLVMTAVWFASLASNKVSWAGRRLVILPGGTMREVDE